MYQLKITTKARAQLRKISKAHQQRAILVALEDLRTDPHAGKPLTRELTGRYSYKVGVYRVIYKIKEKDKLVYIITAGHRSIIYQI